MKQLVMMGLGEAFHKICDSAILQGMFPDGQILALCDSDASKAGEQYIINKKRKPKLSYKLHNFSGS